MRALLFTLVILLTTFQAYGQILGKKKSKDVDPRDAQIDSLTTLTKTLSLQLDSVSGELSKYAVVTDSLKVPGDTTSVLVAAAPAAATSAPAPVPLLVEPKGPATPDSVAILLLENKRLAASTDSMKLAWKKTVEMLTGEEIIKATAVHDLKKLKELLDSGIITVTEFTSLKKKYLEKL